MPGGHSKAIPRRRKPREKGVGSLRVKKVSAAEAAEAAAAVQRIEIEKRRRQQRSRGRAERRTEPIPTGHVALFEQKDEPDAPYFQLRLSDKKGAEYTAQARTAILQGRPEAKAAGKLKAFNQHYGLTSSAYSKLRKKFASRASTTTAARPGRKKLLGKRGLDALDEANKKARGASINRLAKIFTGVKGGMYRNKQAAKPCFETIRQAVAEEFFVVHTKVRPRITPANEISRLACAKHLLDNVDTSHWCDIDEKYFPMPIDDILRCRKGEVYEDLAGFVKQVGHKKHIPKLMAAGVVAQPQIRENWTEETGPWLTDGKIGIYRSQRTVKAGKGKFKYDYADDGSKTKSISTDGKAIRIHSKGDAVEIDCTMDGEVYRDMMAGRTNADEGILDDIAAYFDRHGRKRGERINLQEDGAPGHGYSSGRPTVENPWAATPTDAHEFWAQGKALRLLIDVYKQSPNSPELNGLDLGVWAMLKAAVDDHANEFLRYRSYGDLLDALWDVIEKEFWAMEPAKLWVIMEHKKAVAEKIKKGGGAAMRKDPTRAAGRS